jgi:hypothetical protein
MLTDELFAAVAEAFAGLPVDVDKARSIVKQKQGVGRVVDKRAEARLARPKLILRPLALGDVPDQRQEPPPSSLLEGANANLDGERGVILAALMAFERDRLFGEPALRELRNRHLVEIRVE